MYSESTAGSEGGGGGKRLVNGSGLSAIPGTYTQRAAPRERPRLYDMLLRGETRGKRDEEEGCGRIAGKAPERQRDRCAGSDLNGSDHTKTRVLSDLEWC